MGELVLFFSKLIPLLFYPLGLTSVLLLIAIVNFWTKPRRAAIAIGLALGVLLLSSSAWFSSALLYSLERQYPPLSNPPAASAIIILGGSTYAPNPPRSWPEVNEAGDRVLYGAKLYREGKAPKIVASGGRIEWKDGGQAEAIDMQTLLETMGVPGEAVLLEPESLNTYENARNTKKILAQNNLTGDMLLVTSATHMPRSMAVFRKQGMQVVAAPTDFLVETERQSIQYKEKLLNLLPDAIAMEHTTRAMKEYIGTLIYRLRGWL